MLLLSSIGTGATLSPPFVIIISFEWPCSYNNNCMHSVPFDATILHSQLSSHFTLFSFSLTIFMYTDSPNVPWVQPTLFIKYVSCLSFFMQVSYEYIPPSEAYLSISIRTRAVQFDLCTRNYLTNWKWSETSCIGVQVVPLYGFIYIYTHMPMSTHFAVHAGSASSFIHLTQCQTERECHYIQTIEWIFVCVCNVCLYLSLWHSYLTHLVL